MAELLIKVGYQGAVGDHKTWQDHDVIRALPNSHIGYTHANALFKPRPGTPPVLSEGYMSLTRRWKVERISKTELRKSDLWNPPAFTEYALPHLAQRLVRMKPEFLFGKPGSERFYMSPVRMDPATVNAVWAFIEGNSAHFRSRYERFPWGAGDLATNLAIRTPDITEAEAEVMHAPLYSGEPVSEAEYELIAKRTRRYVWDGVLELSAKQKGDVRVPGRLVDTRDTELSKDLVSIKSLALR